MIDTHLEPDVLEGYRDLTVTAATAAAVECHLMACERCRNELATLGVATADARLLPDADLMWERVLDEVDRPRVTVVERAMRRIGIPEATARLLAITPALRVAWLVGVVAVGVLAQIAAEVEGLDPAVLLALAPLIPVLGVATAFGPVTDPTYELGLSTPTSGFRLTMIRTAAVLATTLPLLVVTSVAVDGVSVEPVAWLLPCLMLVAVTLALATWFTIEVSALVATVGWLTTLTMLEVRQAAGSALADALLSGTTGQLLVGAATLAAALVVAGRRQAFNSMPTSGAPR